VVTAERRQSNLQTTPLTIDVFGADQLSQSGVTSVQDLGKLSPGLEIGTGGPFSQIFIRGVGDLSFSPLANPGVAVNVDGIYVGRPEGVNGNMYDIERVEVIKGPQGTLYGRNANGGSINIITAEPELGVLDGKVDVEGGDYSLAHVDGAANLPLGDRAAMRVAFNLVHRDGYLSDGTDDDIEQSGRVRFKVEPSDDLKIGVNVDYTHLGGDGVGYVWLARPAGTRPWDAVSSTQSNLALASTLPLGPLLDPVAPDSSQNVKLWNASAELDWNLGFGTLTVLPAFRHSDVDTLSSPGYQYDANIVANQSSLEVRLGNSGPRLTWVGGLYYINERSTGTVSVLESNNLQNNTVLYEPATQAPAAFGQATFAVTDQFRLIAGARYTREHRTLSGEFVNNSPLTGGPNLVTEMFQGDKTFDGTTWRAGAEYDVAPHSMIYFTASTGFKSGGLSQTIAPANVYQPEKLTAYELGSKNRFFANRLQLNLSAFDWKYKDLQDQRVGFDPTGNINFLTFNAGSATLNGVSVDLTGQPTLIDTLSLSGEYVDAKYDSFNYQIPTAFFNPASTGCVNLGSFAATPLPVTRLDCSGNELAHVPKFTANAAYDHKVPLGGKGTFHLGGDLQYVGSRWLATDFTPAERARSYTGINAHITYESPANRWSVSAYVRNIANQAYYTGGIEQPFAPPLFASTIGPPRTFAARVSYRFGP
jgi:iron complex outermembrane receptor protein